MNSINEENCLLNYEDSEIHISASRKHVFSDSKYHVYVLKEWLILCTEPCSKHPKYRIPINIQTVIHWQVAEKTKQLTGFGFIYKKELKYFSSKESELLQLREALRKKIMFKDIADFYKPSEFLGKGGSSKVYLVTSKNEEQKSYACKCVDKKYLEVDGGFHALFMEIEYMQKLNHPSIIGLQELFEGENTFYIILEYLQGKSLNDIIHQQRLGDGFTIEQIQVIMKQLLSAIAYFHDRNIMHRDLKPENIMFKIPNNMNTLKVVDFGLATSTLVESYPFPKCGTPGYVAPEIANLKDSKFKYDKVCDIFSAGCIFYKLQILITLKELFPGTEYEEILNLNKKCKIDLSILTLLKAPPAAIDLIKKMLIVSAKDRPSAAQCLQHPFFQGKDEGVSPPIKKNGFKKQKEENKKQAKTTNFNTVDEFQQENIQLNIMNAATKKEQDDCDIVDDEGLKLPQVPVMRKRKFQMGSFVMKGEHHDDASKMKLKKTQTSDWDDTQLVTKPPNTNHHPSFIMQNQGLIKNLADSGARSPYSEAQNSPQVVSPDLMIQKLFEQNCLSPQNVIVEKEDEESINFDSKHSMQKDSKNDLFDKQKEKNSRKRKLSNI